MLTGEKVIYDSVHGYIRLTEKETKIVNSIPFQRLHYIKQLGPTYLVYPNAQHTRFAHSLGVLSIMSRFAGKLQAKGAINSEELRILRLAALLHDIGHYPFSHSIEYTKPRTSPHFIKHEAMAEHVIENTKVSRLLAEDEKDEIIKIITGRTDNPFFRYLMTSDADVDRTDYLLRDAHHTGVAYGAIDLNRVLECVDVDESGIVFLEKGTQSIENLLLARSLMYQSVYFHKATVAFESLLTRIHRIMVEQGKVYDASRVQGLKAMQWYHYNDYYLMTKMKSVMRKGDFLNEMVSDFMKRCPLKLVDKQHEADKSADPKRFKKFRTLSKESKLIELATECDIDPEWLFYVELPITFIETRPEKYPTRIRCSFPKEEVRLLYEMKPNLCTMSDTELRLYTRKALYDKVEPVITNFLS
ncbi:MAG: HD domain-containing protein [Candidatus Thorarchaeota archaeon]